VQKPDIKSFQLFLVNLDSAEQPFAVSIVYRIDNRNISSSSSWRNASRTVTVGLEPSSGLLDKYSAQNIEFKIDPSGLEEGDYSMDIIINSTVSGADTNTSKRNSVHEVPISLEVTSTASAADTNITFSGGPTLNDDFNNVRFFVPSLHQSDCHLFLLFADHH